MSDRKRENEETENACRDNVSNFVEVKMESARLDDTNNFPDLHDVNYRDQNVSSTPNRKTIKRELSESPLKFKSPLRLKNQDKSLRSDDVAQNMQFNKIKRLSISSSDYETFKSELEDPGNLENIEEIKLAHDLDAVIHFNGIRESSDILFSSIMDINRMQEIDDSTMQTIMSDHAKDPLTDPLCISDREEKDIEDGLRQERTFVESESRSPLKKQQRRRSTRLLSNQTYYLSEEDSKTLEEENIEEENELPLITIQKLQKLKIKLVYEVPPQHQIELTGSHAPTREIRKLFQTHGPLRKGLYSPLEDEIITKNWKMFCKLHDWDPKNVAPFFYWRYNGRYYIESIEERQKFVQFLANGLPWRTLYSVHNRFKVLYQNKIVNVRYTSKEDKKILIYMKNRKYDINFVKLAKLLGRTEQSIRRRYRRLRKKVESEKRNKSDAKPLENVRWTLPLIKQFIKTLLSITLSEDLKELKCATFPKPVWQKMEKKLNIHEKVLKTFWQHQLHLQLFSTSRIYLNDIKIQLIEYMYAKGISHTREIIWPNVARHFEGATAEFLCKVFYYLVQECDMYNVDNFAEIVEYLYHKKIPKLQEVSTDKFLPRIVYKNDKINLVDVEENNDAIISSDSQDIDNDVSMNSDSDSDT